MTEVSGDYTNGNYGFKVAIPAGIRAFMATPPSPNHGIRIVLGDHRTIEISAAFDAALYGSSTALLDALLANEPHGPLSRSNALLDGKPAARAKTKAHGMREDIVVQWIDHAPDDAINVQAVLTTTDDRDEAIFDRVLHGFRIVKRAE